MGDRAERLKRASAAAALGLGLTLSFPFRAGELAFDAGAVVGWVALLPLAWLVGRAGPRAAFGWTLAGAAAGYAGVLFWLYVVVTVHGGAAPVFGVAAVGAVALYFALHAALAAAVAAWPGWSPRLRAVLVLPAAWVVTEHLRSFDLFGGFPWAYLGYAGHADGPLLELAALGGVWGLSFLLACFAGLLASGRWRTAVVLLCAAHLAGFALRFGRPAEPDPAPLRAAVVQASIPQQIKWDRELARRHFQAHLDLTRLVAAGKPLDLIVWPEASVPVLLEAEPEYRRSVVELSAETGAVLVLGGTGLGFSLESERPRVFNSAFVVTPDAGVVDRYDKTQLVPFGEYVPLRGVFGAFSAVASGLAGLHDLTPGESVRRLETRGAVVPRHAPAALICYELIYPDLVRRAARSGAGLLLNLTNDAWYGRSSAPHQFMAIASLRAAENGLPMLRAANTGVSGFIDAGGIVLDQTPIFERRALAGDVPPRRPETLYARYGDWVVWASWGLLLGLGGLGLVGRDRSSRAGDRRGTPPAP